MTAMMQSTRTRVRGGGLVLVALLLLGQSGCTVPDDRPQSTVSGPCPRWFDDPADLHANAASPDLGCMNRANRASMVESPADLREGRPLGPASGARESLGIKAYEEGRVKAFKNSSMPGPTIVLPGGAGGQ